HNGVNEDDPNAPPRRGRLAREGGTIIWQPPPGDKVSG
ncbi:MAG: HNH endonuclease signature motif containing protein, partial [Corynebacterium flavescens]